MFDCGGVQEGCEIDPHGCAGLCSGSCTQCCPVGLGQGSEAQRILTNRDPVSGKLAIIYRYESVNHPEIGFFYNFCFDIIICSIDLPIHVVEK